MNVFSSSPWKVMKDIDLSPNATRRLFSFGSHCISRILTFQDNNLMKDQVLFIWLSLPHLLFPDPFQALIPLTEPFLARSMIFISPFDWTQNSCADLLGFHSICVMCDMSCTWNLIVMMSQMTSMKSCSFLSIVV